MACPVEPFRLTGHLHVDRALAIGLKAVEGLHTQAFEHLSEVTANDAAMTRSVSVEVPHAHVLNVLSTGRNSR